METPDDGLTVKEYDAAELLKMVPALPEPESELTVGLHTLTAEHFTSTTSTTADLTSSPVDVTVNPARTFTTIVPSSNPAVAGTSITFTASAGTLFGAFNHGGTVTPPTGTVSGSPNLTFTVTNTGAAVAGTTAFVGITSNGQALFTFTPTTPLAAGTYTIQANYLGDSNYLASSSRPVTEQVVAPAAGSVTTGTSGSVINLSGGRALSINVSEDAGGTASGSVTFTDSSTNGITFTSSAITSVVFNPDGTVAEISGTGTAQGSTDPLNFTLRITNGTTGWLSAPKVESSRYRALDQIGSRNWKAGESASLPRRSIPCSLISVQADSAFCDSSRRV